MIIWFVTKPTTKPTANTSPVMMNASVWKLTPVVATIDAQDEDECVSISADDEDITFIEEEIGNLLQDTFSGDKVDDEWLQPHLEVLQVEPSVQWIPVPINKIPVKIAGINNAALYDTRPHKSCMSYICYTKLMDPPLLSSICALSVHSEMGHDLCTMGLIICWVMLGNIQFMHTFIVFKNVQKELLIWLHVQQLHYLGCHLTESGHKFLHQGTNVLINSIDSIINELLLWTISNIEIPTCCIATISTMRTGTYMSGTPCVY